MAVIVEAHAPSQEMYEAVSSRAMSGGRLPDGCHVHIAGPAGDRWRVLTVWDSREAFEKFREEKLLPTFREVAGDDSPPPPDPDVNDVHTFIK